MQFLHQNKKLVCSCCNNTVYSDEYGFLFKEKDDDISYKYVSDWMSFISEKVFNELKENKDYSLTSKATLKMINYKKHRFEKVNDIEITLKGKDFYKEISIHETFILPFSPGKHFEIQDGKEIYRIELENPKHTRKWITVLNAFYKIRHL